MDDVLDIFWMARRYARGRATFAASIVNEFRQKLLDAGMTVASDPTLVEDGNSNPDVLDIVE